VRTAGSDIKRAAVAREEGAYNHSVTSIDLDRNSVGNDGASALAAALRRNATLTSLRYARSAPRLGLPCAHLLCVSLTDPGEYRRAMRSRRGGVELAPVRAGVACFCQD
jgi:hypothetical protein